MGLKEEVDFNIKKKDAEKHAEKVKQRQELYAIRHKNDKVKEKTPTSKVVLYFMITNCVVIEIYSLVVILVFRDLTPLPMLISAVIGGCISFLGYEYKSMKENTVGGIVYESAMKKLEYELENNTEDAVG